MYFLSPKIIDMNRNQFLNSFFTKVLYKRPGETEKHFYKLSKLNLDHLYKLIEPYIFKSDLEFNKKETLNEFVASSHDIEEEYQLVKRELMNELKFDSSTLLLKLMKLEHISARSMTKAVGISAQCQYRQVIVYCKYLDELEMIKSQLNNQCFVITGETTKSDRTKIINKFKKNDLPLLMTYGVGSFGLNLQFCNEIIFSSLIFDYAKIEQAKYRIKRIGQERDIKYSI
jgi:SNF2 family DNA or RNA helicase